MTKRGAGSRAGSWVLSARFLAWAEANGHVQSLDAIAQARVEYRESGADSSRYEVLTNEELSENQAKAISRVNRLTAETARRESLPAPASSG